MIYWDDCQEAIDIAEKHGLGEADVKKAKDLLVKQLETACRITKEFREAGYNCAEAAKFAVEHNMDTSQLWKILYNGYLDICRQNVNMYDCGKAIAVAKLHLGSDEKIAARSLFMQHCLAHSENFGKKLCNEFADDEERQANETLLF